MKEHGSAFIGAAILLVALTLGSLNAFAQAKEDRHPAGNSPVRLVKEGMLIYSATNQPLRSVLEEIGDRGGVAVIIADGVGEEQISVEFKDFRVDEALRQILKDYDTFFFYGMQKNNNAVASLKAVWVYPANQGRALKPVPQETWASTQEFERMLDDREQEVRARAIDTLIKRKGQQAGKLVMKALRDESDLVRTQALDRALSSNLDIQKEALVNLALNDRSVNVRFLALEALSEDPNSRWVAERALEDPNARIQNMAREILRQIDVSSESPDQPATRRRQSQ